jgi:hypothetical protein
MQTRLVSTVFLLACARATLLADERAPAIRPESWIAHAGRAVDLRLADRRLRDSVRLVVRSRGAQEWVPPTTAEPGASLVWRFTPPVEGTYIFAATIEPPDTDAGPASDRYEKLFLRAAPRDAEVRDALQPSPSATAAFGHRLELVPVVDPTCVRVGDDLPVRVKFDGDDLAAAVVTVRRDGRDGEVANHEQPGGRDARSAVLHSNASGTINLRVTGPGIWILSVEHLAAGDPKIDEPPRRYVATMAFAVADEPRPTGR